MSNWYALSGREVVGPIGMNSIQRGIHHVGDTTIGGSRISTVFLGLDHSFTPGAKPVVFETLVFGGPLSDEMVRYCTYDEAEAGHAAMVERVKTAAAASFSEVSQ